MFEILISKSLFLVLIYSGLPLLACFLIGLICSIIQTATQVQEQSMAFLLKFLCISALFFIFFPSLLAQFSLFIKEILGSFATIGRQL